MNHRLRIGRTAPIANLLSCSCLAALTTLSLTSRAWGPVGHETVANIAEDNLTPLARSRVQAILGKNTELASVATWADDVRSSSRPETAPWHFIDIEDRAQLTEADELKYCSGHDCVVDQVNADVATLKSKTSTASQRFEALKFLVHFVGDLHQPLHCADDNDHGGNDKWVVFFSPGGPAKGSRLKLHALWDRLIEVQTSEDASDLAAELEDKIKPSQRSTWAGGTPADWAWESYLIAHDTIYASLQPGPSNSSGIRLPKNYTTKMRPLVDIQLEKAGIRLAYLLNDALGR